MIKRDVLAALIDELRGLPDGQLDRTLAALSYGEREQVLALLKAEPAPETSFAILADLSPWLIKRLEAARNSAANSGPCFGMTEAARGALLASLGAVDRPAAGAGAPKTNTAPLIERFLRRLPGRRHT